MIIIIIRERGKRKVIGIREVARRKQRKERKERQDQKGEKGAGGRFRAKSLRGRSKTTANLS